MVAAAGFQFLDEIVWAILKSTANGSPEIEENKRIEQREIDEVLSVKSCRKKGLTTGVLKVVRTFVFLSFS